MWLRFLIQATSVEWKKTALTKKAKRKEVTPIIGAPGFLGDFPLIDGFSTSSECGLGLRGNSNLSRFQCPLADRGEEINHVEAKGFIQDLHRFLVT